MLKKILLIITIIMTILTVVNCSCDDSLVDGVIKKATESSEESEIGKFFKNVGCSIQNGAKKLGENAKKVGESIKEGAKNFGEKTKQFGRDIKEKFSEFKDKWNNDDEDGNKEPITSETVKKIENDAERIFQIDERFLYVPLECPEGQKLTSNGKCETVKK
ncbi:uncharacterized protein LOC129613238 [Condylostylus longicornis]|uniref:uncharacterized protein LOC129613238 n=1 Tax=Condylostylus longicornis TaxID=2530218 RepID=UPI00244DD0AB|nr:uncharacterized protein LOC129613238 [Condylostylus longicornis]